jgi:hypothetical protein
MTNRIRPDDANPHEYTDTSLSYTLGRLKPLPIPALPSSTVVPAKNVGHAVLGAMEREMENRMSAQFERKLDDAMKAMENRMAAQFEQKLINALQEQSRGMINFSPAVLPQTELRTSVVQAFDGDHLSPHAPLSGGPVLSSGHSAPKTLLRRPTSIRLDTGKTVSPAPVSSPSPGSLSLSPSPPSSLCSFSHCISYV